MSGSIKEFPLRSGTMSSTFASQDAVLELDPATTAGLLIERLRAWKHACGYLEGYVGAVEKAHTAHSKEYEKVLKSISAPLREGKHFDQDVGGVAGFFENIRVNTQAMITSNIETGKTIKGTVLPILDRLHKEIKAKSKEVMNSAGKSAKEVEKARNITQKHIEQLGQQAAAYESAGARMNPSEDPYVLQRGIYFRLNKQVMEENNHHNDLIHVQDGFRDFEAHVVQVLKEAMSTFDAIVGGQAEKNRALWADVLGAVQRIPPDFEWNGFLRRDGDKLANPSDPPRSVEALTFPNQDHFSTKPLLEGMLERKSRNKLSFSTQTGYYVVTPAKFLHEFKDDDNFRADPKPELSIYLPEAVISSPNGERFQVKGKDKGKSFSSKLAGMSELNFRAQSAAEAQKWLDAIRTAAGPGVISGSTPVSPTASTSPASEKTEAAAHKEQEAGITGGTAVSSPTVMSPTVMSPTSPTAPDAKKPAA